MAYRGVKGADPFSTKTSRNERFAQMSKQEQLIEQKKREIQARLQERKQKEAEEALKKLQCSPCSTKNTSGNSTNSLNSGGGKDKIGRKTFWRSKFDSKENPQISNSVVKKGKVNLFANDGSFMDQFRKLSGVKDSKIKKEEDNASSNLGIVKNNSSAASIVESIGDVQSVPVSLDCQSNSTLSSLIHIKEEVIIHSQEQPKPSAWDQVKVEIKQEVEKPSWNGVMAPTPQSFPSQPDTSGGVVNIVDQKRPPSPYSPSQLTHDDITDSVISPMPTPIHNTVGSMSIAPVPAVQTLTVVNTQVLPPRSIPQQLGPIQAQNSAVPDQFLLSGCQGIPPPSMIRGPPPPINMHSHPPPPMVSSGPMPHPPAMNIPPPPHPPPAIPGNMSIPPPNMTQGPGVVGPPPNPMGASSGHPVHLVPPPPPPPQRPAFPFPPSGSAPMPQPIQQNHQRPPPMNTMPPNILPSPINPPPTVSQQMLRPNQMSGPQMVGVAVMGQPMHGLPPCGMNGSSPAPQNFHSAVVTQAVGSGVVGPMPMPPLPPPPPPPQLPGAAPPPTQRHPPPPPQQQQMMGVGPEVSPAAAQLARMVAEGGDEIEEMARQKNRDDPAMWFLYQMDSVAYIQYRCLVEKLRNMKHEEEKDKNINFQREQYIPEEEEKQCLQNDNPSKKMNEESQREDQSNDGLGSLSSRRRKRKSRWDPENSSNSSDSKDNSEMRAIGTGSQILLSKITRSDPNLIQYAIQAFGTCDLSEDDWKKAEDHYKINLLYQDMVKKRQEIERLQRAGKFKYEYDSDEETEGGGTWEHKLRSAEMEATQLWAEELTLRAQGKHHIGDFLPPDELEKFLEKYNALKEGREPDLSDYKEYKLRENNIGFQMLQKLGWSEGQGLGSDGQGITDPVNKASSRPENQGLGLDRPDDVSRDDDEYEAYRKRMMLAYRFRPNPLNNPRRPYY
ncbi:hypothetical protein J437_LFUL005098 [Ladona fulva]|uniref:G-patch domain-containing protein n=1 Tax=Ladona fulva TaxID=123851 RepID=A0A8K0JYI2_LADFU|nr:hypothetical protein J437_LFUL005098 [Ladona fulva]